MKRIAKWMGILISVLFLSGSAWGYDAFDHVKASPNSKGDLLLFKYYVVANGGWETKISVTNTNMAASVVAKVVIRSYKNSAELLDFLIYLSPADVWTAKLYWDGTQTKIYSEDSSCLNQNGTWASATDPLDYALKTIGTSFMPFCPDDSTAVGYVYVIQAAWSNAALTDKYDFSTPGVSHALIKTWYEQSVSAHTPFWTWQYLPEGYAWNNSLFGYEVFSNAGTGIYSSSVQAQALADYKSETYLALTETNRLGAEDSNNTLAEIEAALSREYISMPYMEGPVNGATIHVIGFPTKYTKKLAGTDTPCEKLDFDGPFFKENTTSYRVPLTNVKVWDVNEVYSSTQVFSPSPTAGLRDEVNLLAVSSINADDFPEGWVSYPMSSFITETTNTVTVENKAGQPITYEGAPVTCAVVFFGGFDSYSINGAWSDGAVTVQGQTLPSYKYTDAYTFIAD
jgi:hypothetical protein